MEVCLTNKNCVYLDRTLWELDHKEGWMPKIDAFELWCWRRLLRVPWTTRRPNQSILKEINPEYSLEKLMLKLQHFGHLMQRANSLEKTLMLGDWGQEEKGATEDEMVGCHHWPSGLSLSKFREIVKDRESLTCCSYGVTKSCTWLSEWKTTLYIVIFFFTVYQSIADLQCCGTFISWSKEQWLRK